MKRNSVCASSFFCFSSDNTLHCMSLLALATLKLPVFWSSRKLTSLRGTGASALPPPHHLSLTICLAAMAKLHSNWPSTTTTKPTWLHTCAASARRNDAHPPRRRCPNKSSSCSCRREGGGGGFLQENIHESWHTYFTMCDSPCADVCTSCSRSSNGARSAS